MLGSNFKDLMVWQKAHQLVLEIYKITTEFPQIEQFCVTQQIRRAAYSIPANIAEGCCRGYTSTETARFAAMAKGSLGEVEYFLLLSKDLGYLDEDDYQALEAKCLEIARMLNGLIKSLTKNISSS